MTNYNLQPNESVLYTGSVSMEKRSGSNELTLTNLNIIIVNTVKKLFAKEQVTVETYPVEQIKVYNEMPQIKQKYLKVEVFLTSGEVAFSFQTKTEAHKFVNAAMQLLTGKSVAERRADKVKGAIGLVDNALGINTADTVKNALENGIAGTILGGFGKKTAPAAKGVSTASEVVGIAKDLFGGKATQEAIPESTTPAAPTDEQLESLKKLKDLVDAGVLTQEEFDAKKKQILGL